MDENAHVSEDKAAGRPGLWRDGRVYFSRQGERRFYFILTVMMLLAGLGIKVGLF